MLEVTSYLKLD